VSDQEFLVNIEFVGEERILPDEVEELLRRERERASELALQGHLVRMWRVPGRRANWGLWRASDPTELHKILESLPYWPYMNIVVHPLAGERTGSSDQCAPFNTKCCLKGGT
jgi:muconolactone D-isomerase